MSDDGILTYVLNSLQEMADLKRKLAVNCGHEIVKTVSLIVECFRAGGKLLFFGNGGSAADAQHLAAEFVGRFVVERRALPAIALTTDSSILTAIANDYGFDRVFARQVEALGSPGDIAVGISTSGNSRNVIEAVNQARKQKIKTVGFLNKNGGGLASCVELAIKVPSTNVARVQECHIAIGHILCELVERELCEK